MNLAKFAIENRAITYFVAVLLPIAGVASFTTLGQLEDPEFTVKTAVIVTTYPGASPEQVELEVTDRIELALQELAERWEATPLAHIDAQPFYDFSVLRPLVSVEAGERVIEWPRNEFLLARPDGARRDVVLAQQTRAARRIERQEEDRYGESYAAH